MEQEKNFEAEQYGQEFEQKKLIEQMASSLHDQWRETRNKLPDGTYEPRIKPTEDALWIKEHGTDQIDIANTSYDKLPMDWQRDNKVSAEVAMGTVFDAVNQNKDLDEAFIEDASAVIHEKWLGRHTDASDEQNKPYNELTDEEKEKDRIFTRMAIDMYKQSKS